jgi:hypothetical protein
VITVQYGLMPYIQRIRFDFALKVINGLAFIAVVESVYSAVRTDSLYKADYVWSLKG